VTFARNLVSFVVRAFKERTREPPGGASRLGTPGSPAPPRHAVTGQPPAPPFTRAQGVTRSPRSSPELEAVAVAIFRFLTNRTHLSALLVSDIRGRTSDTLVEGAPTRSPQRRPAEPARAAMCMYISSGRWQLEVSRVRTRWFRGSLVPVATCPRALASLEATANPLSSSSALSRAAEDLLFLSPPPSLSLSLFPSRRARRATCVPPPPLADSPGPGSDESNPWRRNHASAGTEGRRN